MSQGEDTFGCIVAAVALIGGGWWLWSKYEINERTPAVVVAPKPILPVRPVGPVEITTTPGGSVWTLDASSVRGSREARYAWVTADHSKDKEIKARYSKSLYRVNCESGGSQEISYLAYDAKDQPIDRYEQAPEKAEIHYYPPGTVGGSVPAEICRSVYDEAK
jgi:surface-adhesin protein E